RPRRRLRRGRRAGRCRRPGPGAVRRGGGRRGGPAPPRGGGRGGAGPRRPPARGARRGRLGRAGHRPAGAPPPHPPHPTRSGLPPPNRPDPGFSASPRAYATAVPTATLALDEAVDLARTGDIWLFRGRTPADRAIQLATNSPVNHVGMAVVLGDLPPLMWHAELGRSLPDVWSGRRQRGVQLHVLSDAVTTWVNRYGQRAWVRQLSPEVTPAMEDAALRVIARLDGTPFPSTVGLASRWVTGRLPSLRRP